MDRDETENLNIPVSIRGIECTIQNPPIKKTPALDSFTGEF